MASTEDKDVLDFHHNANMAVPRRGRRYVIPSFSKIINVNIFALSIIFKRLKM